MQKKRLPATSTVFAFSNSNWCSYLCVRMSEGQSRCWNEEILWELTLDGVTTICILRCSLIQYCKR